MLSAQRQQRFLTYITTHQSAKVSELGSTFNVSLATVRRDLKELEDNGLIRRVHGGALLLSDAVESPAEQRTTVHSSAKQRIGAAAAALVAPNSTIILTSGSTTEAMIPFLAAKSELTVITNALNVAYHLARCPAINVIVLGGWLRHSELSLLGHITVQALHDLHADMVFHGTFGLDPLHGLSGSYMPEVQTDRQLIGAATQLVVLADHTKFGQVGPVRLAPIDAVATVITDTDAPADKIKALRSRNIRVIQA